VARLTAELRAERGHHERVVAALRRAHARRLAAMVHEIAALRHHEAKAEALVRLLAGRDATLAAQAEHITRLEALLQKPGEMR
jgi:hypothetical protein